MLTSSSQMIKNIFTYILAASTLLLASCSTTSYAPYTFEQLRAADYTLPPSVSKVVIATLDTSFSIDDYAIILTGDTIVQAKRLAYSTFIPGMMCAVFSNNINKSEFIRSDVMSKCLIANKLSNQADSILKEHKADAMIVIKRCKYESKLIKPQNSYDSQVMVSTLTTDMQFMMLNGATRQFQTMRDTINWYPNNDGYFPQYKETYYSIAEQAGNHLSAILLPSWETRRRSLLSSNTKSMRDAIAWTERGDWEKARDLWAEEVKSGKVQDQARAAINLGLFYEREDNELESAMWFSKALDIMQNNSKCKSMTEELKFTQQLFNRAIDRQHEKTILDKQMRTTK